jgi:hypothetical protein
MCIKPKYMPVFVAIDIFSGGTNLVRGFFMYTTRRLRSRVVLQPNFADSS